MMMRCGQSGTSTYPEATAIAERAMVLTTLMAIACSESCSLRATKWLRSDCAYIAYLTPIPDMSGLGIMSVSLGYRYGLIIAQVVVSVDTSVGSLSFNLTL